MSTRGHCHTTTRTGPICLFLFLFSVSLLVKTTQWTYCALTATLRAQTTDCIDCNVTFYTITIFMTVTHCCPCSHCLYFRIEGGDSQSGTGLLRYVWGSCSISEIHILPDWEQNSRLLMFCCHGCTQWRIINTRKDVVSCSLCQNNLQIKHTLGLCQYFVAE